MRTVCGLAIAALVAGSLAAEHRHEGGRPGHAGAGSHGAGWSDARSSPRYSRAAPMVAVPYVSPPMYPDNPPPADQPYTDSYQSPQAADGAGDSSRPQYAATAEPPPHGLILDFTDSDAVTPEPPHYYIALKDHHVYLAVAYWVERDTLHYFLPGNTHNQVSLSLVDYGLTQRLNRESGTEVQLPATK
jgi:hypothetical protein